MAGVAASFPAGRAAVPGLAAPLGAGAAGAGKVMPSTAARRARSAGVRVFIAAANYWPSGERFASISR